MLTEVRSFIDTLQYHQGALRQVAERLPSDDTELDQWIATLVERHDLLGFWFVLSAALATDRKVSARHLAQGTALMPGDVNLCSVAWHMNGNVAEHLLTALRANTLTREVQAAALLAAAGWCREYRDGDIPPGLIAEARLMARIKDPRHLPLALLLTAESIIADPGLTAILRSSLRPDIRQKAIAVGEGYLKICRASFLESTPAKPDHQLARGATMRRSVERLGRNEPCPCGSGAKYKRCCFDKDQERLHHSTHVAGKTHAELFAEPELQLTEASLDKTHASALVRFDPLKVPARLLRPYFMRLTAFGLFDKVADDIEKFIENDECAIEDIDQLWNFVIFFIFRVGDKPAAERMERIRERIGSAWENKPHPGFDLLLARDDPARFLQILKDISLAALTEENPDTLTSIAYGILCSPLSALGILVARSMIPLIVKKDATFLLTQILETRDKLGLPPEDPISDILDRRLTESAAREEGKDAGKLHDASKRLETKSAEVRLLKEKLDQLQREVTRQEKHRTVTPAPSSTPASDPQTLQELRTRIGTLKSRLQERHEERTTLRQDLQKAHTDLETLRQHTPAPTASEPPDREDELFQPAVLDSVQPIRLITFPPRFAAALALLPKQNARTAMVLIGRLAAGEPAAYVGVVRLKAAADTLRQRIGSDYRLLFRLHPDHVEIIDLINRRDLDRRIKLLRAHPDHPPA